MNDQAQKLGHSEREAEELRNLLAKAGSQRRQLIVESPVEGILQASAVFTLGQVVTTGQDLARVVPLDSELEIEVYVLNRDIGFIQPGQPAVVKVESFPVTRYGSLEATVKQITTDSLPQQDAQLIEGNPNATSSRDRSFAGTERIPSLVFPVTLRPAKDVIEADGVVVALTPAMAVTVEIQPAHGASWNTCSLRLSRLPLEHFASGSEALRGLAQDEVEAEYKPILGLERIWNQRLY